MTPNDLQILEIGLELLRLEEPLDGNCDDLISALLRVIRFEKAQIGSQRDFGPAEFQAESTALIW